MLLEHRAEPGPGDIAHGASALHLAATLRGGDQVSLELAPSRGAARTGPHLPVRFLRAAARDAAGLVGELERLADERTTGLVLLVEEPELFLRPQSQRYLYR